MTSPSENPGNPAGTADRALPPATVRPVGSYSKRLEFSRKTKARRFEFAKGRCEGCGVRCVAGKFQYDHDKEAVDGGDNSFENCRVLCDNCHKLKTKHFTQRLRKSERQRDKNIGAFKSKRGFLTNKSGPFKMRMDGTIERRDA